MHAPAATRAPVRPDDATVATLIRQHLPLAHAAVHSLAARLPRHVSRDELTSAALLGLTQAARSFDGDRGVSFATFAKTRIRGALLDELRDEDWASRSVRALGRRIDDAADSISRDQGRPATEEELAAALDVDVETIRANAADRTRAQVLRLEALPAPGWADELLPDDGMSPDDVVVASEQRACLGAAIAHLPERLRAVVVGSFLEERTLKDLADELGVTESRVSQMRSEALGWLREGMQTLLGGDDLPAGADVPVGARAARKRAAYRKALNAA